MQRVWKLNLSIILVVTVCVMSLFCGVTDVQGEQVLRPPTSDPDSATTPVAATQGEIKPSDVFAHVALLRDELELIRSKIGKPRNTRSEIDASNVAPREVFFQALTLFRKADALCFEIVRTRATLPEIPDGEIRPEQVWSVVDAVLDRIRLIKVKLAITEQASRHAPIANHGPTDVFRSIVQANRQLNLLLDHEFSLSQLFQQVTVGVSYASRLLSRFSGVETIPMAPPVKRDADLQAVRDQLLGCFARARAIAEHSGLEVMSLSSSSSDTGAFAISELYDVATMVVSELAYMHSIFKDIRPPQQVYYPGDKLPAQVYERVGILALQLEHLQRLVNENPNSFHMSEYGSVGQDGWGKMGGGS